MNDQERSNLLAEIAFLKDAVLTWERKFREQSRELHELKTARQKALQILAAI